MISAEFLIRLTLVIGVASTAVLLSWRASAGVRHRLSLIGLLTALMLPGIALLPALATPSPFRFVVHSNDFLASNPEVHFAWFPFIWIVGSMSMLVRAIAGTAYLHVRISRLEQAFPDGLASEFPEWAIRRFLAPVASPMVLGWFRPRIVFPLDFPEWTAENRRVAILHEAAHLRRGDTWSLLITLAARTLYWFHPLVWWLAARAEEQQELACDDQVLQTGVDARVYAGLLLESARRFRTSSLLACAMLPKKSLLKSRVEHILCSGSSRRSSLWSRTIFAFALVALIGVSAVDPASVDKPGGTPIFSIGGDVSAPTLLKKTEPDYTKKARQRKIQGIVLLDLVVGVDGTASQIRVEKGLDRGLDANAIKAIRAWRFQPGTKAGLPVAVRAKVEVHYQLK